MAINIKQQRKRLGVSQTTLARKLGMSRPTLIKVEQGERPLSDQEQRIADAFFASLEEHQTAADVRINIPEQNLAKFKQVLLYILKKVGAQPNVGMTVLYKLLYFADFDYYEKYEEQLMGLTYIKNTHGPTPREFVSVVKDMKAQEVLVEVKSKYFAHEQKKYLPNREPDLSLLSGRELELVDDVLDRYAHKSARQLSELSHHDMPWQATDDKQNIDYELVFYRSDQFSVRDDDL